MTDNPHYVTPEEAIKKICPLKATSDVDDVSGQCVSHECMAWRWVDKTSKTYIWAATDSDPKPRENWIAIEEYEILGRKAGMFKEGPTHGYCGMVRS
jgi:hypothetical protein